MTILLAIFRMVVIPAQFQDGSFTCTADEIKATVASAEAYFNSQFSDKTSFVFDLAPTVTLSGAQAYYGANYTSKHDVLLHEAVREACRLSAGKVDFSLYDNDSDGTVDNVFVITAGLSEDDGAGENCIWPQQGYLQDNGGTLSLGGKRINSYSVCTELKSDRGANPRKAGIGLFCHEFAHCLGLTDLYDTDGKGSGGYSPGLWGTGMMDTGCKNNDGNTPPNLSAVDMDILGVGTCETLTKGEYTLKPIEVGRRYLKALTDTEGEYFLFECREAAGWDAPIGGGGLLVYHIDKSSKPAGYSDYYQTDLTAAERWNRYQVNCRPDRECAKLVAADPLAADASGIFFPQKDLDSFGSDTAPSFRYWSGKASNLALSGIKRNADGSVSFKVIEPINIEKTEIFQDAAIVSWKKAQSLSGVRNCTVSWTGGGKENSAELAADATSFTLEGLDAQTTYSVAVKLVVSDNCAYSANSTFTTKVYRSGTYPYIYLNGTTRNINGSFPSGAKLPLRVFNAKDVTSVKWYFDGTAISADATGYYTLRRSGTLKAEIEYKDGDSDLIIKEIRIQ